MESEERCVKVRRKAYLPVAIPQLYMDKGETSTTNNGFNRCICYLYQQEYLHSNFKQLRQIPVPFSPSTHPLFRVFQ
jgi:hypothetical protein